MKKFKQIFAYVLTCAIVLGLLSGVVFTVSAADPTLAVGDQVLFAKYNSTADTAWSEKMFALGAYWDDANLYIVYDKATAGDVTVNGEAATVTAGATYNTAAISLLKLGTAITKYNQEIADFEIKIGTAVDWTGWLVLRSDHNIIAKTACTAAAATMDGSFPAPYGPNFNVVEANLTINAMPVGDVTKKYLTSDATSGITGYRIGFNEGNGDADASTYASYAVVLIRDSSDKLHLAHTNKNSGRFANVVALNMDYTSGMNINLRVETIPEDPTKTSVVDSDQTMNVYINGKMVLSCAAAKYNGNAIGTSAWRRMLIGGLVSGASDTTGYDITGTIFRGVRKLDITAVTDTGTGVTSRVIKDELHIHDYSAEVAEVDYLKAPATIGEQAVYWKSCSVCGLASTNEADTFKYGPAGDSGDIYAPHLLADPALNGKIEEKEFYLNGKLSDTVDFGVVWNTRAIYLAYKKPATAAELKLTIADQVVTIPAANVYSADGDYIEVKIPWDAVNFQVQNYNDKTTLKIELGELLWSGEVFFTYGNSTGALKKPEIYAGDVELYIPKKGGALAKQDGTGASHSGFRWSNQKALASGEANTVIEYDFYPVNLPEAPAKDQSAPHNWYAATFVIGDENFSSKNEDGSDSTTNVDTRDCMVYGIMNVDGTYHIVVHATAGGNTYYDTGIPSTSKDAMHIRVVYDNKEESHSYDSANNKHTYNKVDMKIFVNGVLVGERENVKKVHDTPNGASALSCVVVAYKQSGAAMEFAVENMRWYKAPSALVDDANTNNNPNTGDNGIAVFAALLVASMTGMALLVVPTIRKKLI